MKRYVSYLLISILFVHIALVLYTNRALYLSRFDADYWKDKFEQSQWGLPLSTRIIGDDGLYLSEGNRLIHGGDPTMVNAEVPPLGKYLIGGSIQLFGNGYWYGFLSTSFLLLMFFFLARYLFSDTFLALAATVLLSVDPLVANQFTLTMLDTLHAGLALSVILCFFKSLKKSPRSIYWTIASGVELGFFTNTKVPIFGPFLGVLVIFFMIKQQKKLRDITFFLISAILAYLVPYLPYFLLGHSILDWLKVQKWIFSFYLHGVSGSNIGSILTTIFMNRYQNFATRAWGPADFWSFIWPMSILSILLSWWILWKNSVTHQFQWIVLASLGTGVFILYIAIPFWPRYLMLLLPLTYLLLISVVARMQKAPRTITIIALIALNALATFPVLFPTPEATVNQFLTDWRGGFFQDMYENTTRETKATTSRQDFHRFGGSVLRDGQIEVIDILVQLAPYQQFTSPQYVAIQITYHSAHLGRFTESRIMTVVRENGRWKIPWNWNFFISGLTSNTHLATTVIPAKRGSIIASDKTKLAEDIDSFMIWITPKNIDNTKEQQMLTFLEHIFENRFTAISLHHRYAFNRQSDWPVPIGVITKKLDDRVLTTLRGFPGISLTPAIGRIHLPFTLKELGTIKNYDYFECCSLLYSTTNYDGMSGVEQEKNDQLKGIDGGTLTIKDVNGKVIRTIIHKDKKDGRDVEP